MDADAPSISRRAILASAGGAAASSLAGCSEQFWSRAENSGPEQVDLTVKTLPTDDDAVAAKILSQFRENLQDAGIAVTHEPVGESELYRDVLLEGDYDVFVAQHPGIDEFDGLRGLLHSRFVSERGWQNPFHFSDITADDYLEDQQRLDGDDRRAVLSELFEFLDETVPYTTIAFPDRIGGVHDAISVSSPPRGPVDYFDVLGRQPNDGPRDGPLEVGLYGEGLGDRLNPLVVDRNRIGGVLELLYDPLVRRVNERRDFDTDDDDEDAIEDITEDVDDSDADDDERDGGNESDGTDDSDSEGGDFDGGDDDNGDDDDNGGDDDNGDDDDDHTTGYVPWLAEDVSWSNSGSLEGTVTLREGLTWHDGEELDADDVAFTIRFLQDTSLGEIEGGLPAPRYRSRSSLVEDVEVVDRRTVEFDFGIVSRPVAARVFSLPILPQHVWEPRSEVVADHQTEALVADNEEPVGSGLFRLGGVTSDAIELEPFDEHVFRQSTDRPALLDGFSAFSGIRFQLNPNPGAMIDALREAEIDVTADTIPPSQTERIQEGSETSVVTGSAASFYMIGYNHHHPELGNPYFRRILSRLIDREYIVTEFFDGRAEPAMGYSSLMGIHDDEWAHDDRSTIATFPGTDGEIDVQRVRSLFEDVGYRYEDGELLN